MFIFYPGTFNPIHKGHLYIARRVEEIYNATVVFIPAYDSPWKPNLKDTFAHRVNMLKACNVPYLDDEKRLPTPSYTYRIVDKLYENWKPVKLILGYDQFFSIDKWQHSQDLKEKCLFIVVPRTIGENEDEQIKNKKEQGWNLEILNIKPVDISSSEIRRRVKNNEDISHLVFCTIKNYIELNCLYLT